MRSRSGSVDPSRGTSGPVVSARSGVDPFIVMDVMAEANRLAAGGADILHMEIGQPSAPAPRTAIEAARRLLDDGRVAYTDALGIPSLRARIARHYADWYGIDVAPERVAVTTGSSGGFQLAFLAAFDPGDRVGLPLPAYPAYRNILIALGLEVVPIDTGPETGWLPTEAALAAAHDEAPLAGLLLASPGNPSGSVIPADRFAALARACDERGIWLVSDEIYHGLVYEGRAETALAVTDEAIVVNSFSKYFCMTGWRVGWLVVPERMVRRVECLAQNLFISVPTLSQVAAEAAFDATEELESVKAGYARNRRTLLEALPALGLDRVLPPDGAFYVYADVTRFTNDSLDFCRRILREAHVAVTPGVDFDTGRGHRFLRLSYAGSADTIDRGIERLGRFLARE